MSSGPLLIWAAAADRAQAETPRCYSVQGLKEKADTQIPQQEKLPNLIPTSVLFVKQGPENKELRHTTFPPLSSQHLLAESRLPPLLYPTPPPLPEVTVGRLQ